MSPTVLKERGFRFFFFSREESRMHVHVHCGHGEAKFWLEPSIELAKNYGLSTKDLTVVQNLRDISRKSDVLGKDTSAIEVTHISQHGFWLLLGERELFLPFEHFPWFQDASIRAIHNVEWPQPHHLYWPELDIDLAVESIEYPERFPLISKGGT